VNLDALLQRKPIIPFAPGTRIPWNDPVFSARMLREHLSQVHDRASRRFEIIERQVAWIHSAILANQPGRILDLGCGPGLYTSRLAALGHHCVGLDFSPASIAHAEAEATRGKLDCTYQLADLREAELGEGFDAALLLFGEFNTFSPDEASALLNRTRTALRDGGRLVLEPQSAEAVQATGEDPPVWSAQGSDLFSDAPHLTLRETAWHAKHSAATERYFVFGEGEQPEVYAQSTRAYEDAELTGMLEAAGFAIMGHYESIGDESEADLFGLVAEATKRK
jgi:SAM-dependent methyltransferase